MAYDKRLLERVREYLAEIRDLKIEEKPMFGGLAFIVNKKMCVNISGDNLMCRFDPRLQEKVAEKIGYQPMVMKGKKYKGYCYINPEGIKTKIELAYFINLCLDYNVVAKSSKKL